MIKKAATIAMLLAWSVVAFAGAPLPEAPKASRSAGDQPGMCVEPIAEMRRNHMEMLKHKRDLTMHDGIRTKTHSLIECVDCHASKDEKGEYLPINAEGQFCASCHTYTAVKMDCFECHSTLPSTTSPSSANVHHNLKDASGINSVLLGQNKPSN